MDAPVRIAFLGAGGIAGHHLKQLQDIPEARVVALCDTDPARVEARAAEFGGRPYTDFQRMLDSEGIDALYVCIPPFAHTDAEIRAAERGIHLFVEKPVALTMEKGLEIAAVVRKAGVITSVGYTLRYFPASVAARDYLRGETVAMVTCNRWGGLPGTPWWRVMAQSGGQLVEQTTHQVDLMRYFLGEITEVHARYATRVLGDLPNFAIPDVQIATFRFESGAIGAVTTSCAMTGGGGKSDMDFLLRDRVLHFTTREAKVLPEGAVQPAAVPDQPNIDRSFVTAVLTGDRGHVRCDYDDGLRTLDVTLAANQSALTGQPVETHFSRAGSS